MDMKYDMLLLRFGEFMLKGKIVPDLRKRSLHR